MKVRELIEKLGEMEPDAEVHITYNYGDHWRTTVAPKVRRVEDGRVVESAYHSMDKVVDEDDSAFDKGKDVVLLS